MVRTIKFLQMLLILGGICAGMASQAGIDDEGRYCTNQTRGPGDDTHPWPWGFEVKFPWDDIQGIWKVQNRENPYYFVFRRVQARRIKIKQIDISNCSVIGVGQGLEKDKTIVAQIRNTYTSETYNLTLYAFNQEDSPEPPVLSDANPGQVLVARINTLDHEPEVAGQMERISDRLELRCGDQDKKTKF